MKAMVKGLAGSIVSIVVAMALIEPSKADVIPYASAGTINTATYSFTASSTGDVIAYFAGSGAAYDNQVGLLINGVATGVIGLDNHTSAVGQSLDLGHANAGDALTFVLQNNTLRQDAYSDPALNISYDDPAYIGSHQHIYSAAYTQTSPIIGTIPAGIYVGFEDLVFPGADFNYTDETFIFTNVSTAAIPEPASLALVGAGLIGLMGWRRVRRS